MGNYLKIYLLFLIPSYIALGLGFYTNYSGQVEKSESDFEGHYNKHTQIYADQIKEIERYYELVMQNAILGVQKEIKSPNISKSSLQIIAKKFNVSHLFLINKSGVFTNSTNEDPAKIPNFFSYSNEYKNLINTLDQNYLTTPIILPFPEKEPHKFLTVWTGEYFIEVGVRITDIAKTISKVLERDKNILQADMKIGSDLYTVKVNTLTSTNLLETNKNIDIQNINYAQSAEENSHSYSLKFHVSKDELNADIQSTFDRYLTNFFLTAALTSLLLFLALKFLRSRVERVTKTLLNLSKEEDYNRDLSALSSNNDIRNLIKAINRLLTGYRAVTKKSVEEERITTINSLTAQVAHDIRSPLEALKSSKEELSILEEDDRIKIKTAINRIEEIAYSLLKMKKEEQSSESVVNAQSAIEKVLIEKRMQYKDNSDLSINFTQRDEFFSSFISISPDSFKRILSNIITNSAEACDYQGIINIELCSQDDYLCIKVSDTSTGFSSSYLKQPFIEGHSTKENGNGLGLHSAKEEIKDVGGEIKLYNDIGSVVELKLKIAQAPEYYLQCINLTDIKKIIILDDDKSIHQIWDKRFENESVELKHFYSGKALLAKYNQIPKDSILLSDYELLGEKINGIDCIEKLNSFHNSILVTARSDEKRIVERYKEMNLMILPKEMAVSVPIKTYGLRSDLVLIDDDNLVHMNWKRTLRKKGIKLSSYYSVADFLKDSGSFIHTTPIYIDSNLGEGLKGEVLSEDVYKLGFEDLHITTGYNKNLISKPRWIKNIIGKSANEIQGLNHA